MIVQKNIIIYINYFFSFIGSISFLVIANFLELKNLEKYILILSISTVFASIIYSSSIKSKLEDNIIKIILPKILLKSYRYCFHLFFYLILKEITFSNFLFQLLYTSFVLTYLLFHL